MDYFSRSSHFFSSIVSQVPQPGSLLIVLLCYLKKVWFLGSCDPPLVEHGKVSGKMEDDNSWVGTVSCAKGFALVKFSYLMSICSDYLSEEILWRWATRDWSVSQEGQPFLCLCWYIAHLVVHLCFCIFVVPYLYFFVCVFVFVHLCIQDWSVVGRWSQSSPPLCAGGTCKPSLIPKVILLHS